MDNNNTGPDERQLGGVFLIIGWIVGFSLVAVLINSYLFGTKAPKIAATAAGTTITLSRDNDTHFRVKGSINGIPITFLVDTGASTVAVSPTIAKQANLAKEAEMQTQTANGNSLGYFTKIDKLNIAGIDIPDVSAIIVPNMEADQALLGMNVLQYFNIEQTSNSMTLTIPQNVTDQKSK